MANQLHEVRCAVVNGELIALEDSRPIDNLDLIDENVDDDCTINSLSRSDFGVVVECAARRVHPDLVVEVSGAGDCYLVALQLGEEPNLFAHRYGGAETVGRVREVTRAYAQRLVEAAGAPEPSCVECGAPLPGHYGPRLTCTPCLAARHKLKPVRSAFHPSQLEPLTHFDAAELSATEVGAIETAAREGRTGPPEPLTLAEVEPIATRAAHDVNPAIRVIVDRRTYRGRDLFDVWLSLGGFELHLCQTNVAKGELDADVRKLARSLCCEVGFAWRPEGWREP